MNNDEDIRYMNDEDTPYKRRITFDIDVPKVALDSDFNSLILRLYKLKYEISNNENTFYIKDHNRNIKEMQNTLEHFIIKEYSNNANTM